MNKKLLITLVTILVANLVSAQGNWFKKAPFGGSERYGAVAFAIGTKAYVGTGLGAAFYDDIWEYDQATDTWTQKASYPTVVGAAVGFAINGKGYIGCGYDGSANIKSFYEYDPGANTWTSKSDYHTGMQIGIGFAIGNKGYIGTGYDGGAAVKEFWEYDPYSDTWTQKADVGNVGRLRAVYTAIGDKGYVGLGTDGTNLLKDFWEYDTTANKWTQKKDFPGGARHSGSAFSIGKKGYVICGQDASIAYYDTWEYNPVDDSWRAVMIFKGGPRELAAVCTIGDKAYVTTGRLLTTNVKEHWEYNPKAPGFYKQPVDTLACAGGDFILKVQGYGDNVLYKWQKDKVDISNWSSDSFLLLKATSGADYGYYRCVIKNPYGSDTSNEALLNLSSGTPKITVQPQEVTVCWGKPISVFMAGESNSTIYYQWYRNGKPIPGATDSFYSDNILKSTDTGYYACEITNVCGTIKTDSVKITHFKRLAKPTVTVEWNAVYSSEAYTYQWRKYNVDIKNATERRYYPKEKAKYSVLTGDIHGCTRLSDEVLWDFSSIESPNGQKVINVFPNPNNGQFNLETNLNGKVNISIINSIGEIVYEAKDVDANNYKSFISLKDARPGLYFVRLKGENISYLYNFLIQK